MNINDIERIDTHCHSHYSNIRLLDCINKPKDIILRAAEIGLKGIALTDHEVMSGAVQWLEAEKTLKSEGKIPSDFKCICGNEIYLIKNRDNESKKKYYHFILLAKDDIGFKQLCKLSSNAWINSYYDRGMERVPTLYSELEEEVKSNPGHLIATTACIGGFLGNQTLEMIAKEEKNEDCYENKKAINDFILWCKNLFGEDFYIEIEPGLSNPQIAFNKRVKNIANTYNIKMIFASDAHYLKPEDRTAHKIYLNSKEGEREVDAFYADAYLVTTEEAYEKINKANYTIEEFSKMCENSMEIKNKISEYNIFHKSIIPLVEVKNYPKKDILENYKVLNKLLKSDNEQERYWVNQCLDKLKEIDKYNDLYLNKLEIEADVIDTIGEKIGNSLFSYFNTFQHYIDLFWQCGSILGPGRGSSVCFLSNYLLGITQLDPLEWDLQYWRFLNKERQELPDIDVDLSPSKREAILEKIREERGTTNVLQVATFGTEGTKSAILSACRGYRSEEYPNGIDADEAFFLSSLIPSERGFLWSLNDVIYGNEEKKRKPVGAFVNEVKQFPGLLETISKIDGVIKQRGIHASGVILYNNTYLDTNAIMKAPSGALITQFELHDSEKKGDVKFDFLVTEICDKITVAIELLQKDGYFDKNMSLRQIYNKYLHPSVIDYKNEKIWNALGEGKVLDVFQFNTAVGLQAARSIKPKTPIEMMMANALIRLTGEEGQERPIDRYIRLKNNINLWYNECKKYGLTEEEIKILEPYYLPVSGVPTTQEKLMTLCMEPKLANFTLGEANTARKICAKKQLDKIPELKEKFINQCPRHEIGEYVWKTAIEPQMSYAFAEPHALAYSFVGIQTLEIATRFPSIYWNTACLIVNSGSIEEGAKGQTNYNKIAKALGKVRSSGINISLIDINKSDFGFKPDSIHNTILYGLKGLSNVGDDLIEIIIKNRPYSSIQDFYSKVKINKTAMISLIKGGAFDSMMDRKEAMKWFIEKTSDLKTRLTLQNMPTLIKYNLLPSTNITEINAKKYYEFNRYLKAVCKKEDIYELDDRAINFLYKMNLNELIENEIYLDPKTWDKKYQKYMDVFRNWIKNNTDTILNNLNNKIFLENWNKYADGTISKWEMDSLCFYYHEHELANINLHKYGLENFENLPLNPIIDKTFVKNGKEIKMFKLSKICGTCIAKDKTKGTVSLLTVNGSVINVKFRKEYFSLFDKQISRKNPDGTKTVIEKSWFKKGGKIIVQGIRMGEEDFLVKKYASTGGHQLYNIIDVLDNGDIYIQTERSKEGEEEDEN